MAEEKDMPDRWSETYFIGLGKVMAEGKNMPDTPSQKEETSVSFPLPVSGTGATLLVWEEKCCIKWGGWQSLLVHGMSEEKTFFYKSITSVQKRFAYLQFTIPGGIESSNYRQTMYDENAFPLSGNIDIDDKLIPAVKDFIEAKITGENPDIFRQKLFDVWKEVEEKKRDTEKKKREAEEEKLKAEAALRTLSYLTDDGSVCNIQLPEKIPFTSWTKIKENLEYDIREQNDPRIFAIINGTILRNSEYIAAQIDCLRKLEQQGTINDKTVILSPRHSIELYLRLPIGNPLTWEKIKDVNRQKNKKIFWGWLAVVVGTAVFIIIMRLAGFTYE
jgi:hypothetical protein